SLSTLDVPEASVAPTIDGVADDAWADAPVIRTSRTVEGAADGATADVRTLWRGDSLFVLFEVTDPEVDLSNSDPWN
ncbi:sugar-binding protein, partial [Streptomyces scabiei]